jgi:hypothetical protein
MLLGDAPTIPVSVPAEDKGWRQAIRDNWWLVLIALATIAVALAVTFFQPL